VDSPDGSGHIVRWSLQPIKTGNGATQFSARFRAQPRTSASRSAPAASATTPSSTVGTASCGHAWVHQNDRLCWRGGARGSLVDCCCGLCGWA